MRVRVVVFSGRPDPTFRLLRHQGIELLTKISSLKETERDPIDKGLGYNGFSITRTEESSDVPEEIAIKDGIILVIHDSERSAKYVDTQRLVEKWLLQIGAQYLEPQLVKYIEKEIER